MSFQARPGGARTISAHVAVLSGVHLISRWAHKRRNGSETCQRGSILCATALSYANTSLRNFSSDRFELLQLHKKRVRMNSLSPLPRMGKIGGIDRVWAQVIPPLPQFRVKALLRGKSVRDPLGYTEPQISAIPPPAPKSLGRKRS